MKEIFETYNLSELRKFARQYNKAVKIAGASKMSKDELISALLKHKKFFKDIKKKVPVVKPPRKPRTKPPTPKPQLKSTPKPPEPKPQPKPPPKAPEPEPMTAKDIFIDGFNTSDRLQLYIEYVGIKNYRRFELWLKNKINSITKKKTIEGINIDFILSTDLLFRKSTKIVKDLLFKYGVESTFKNTKKLLESMVDTKNVKISYPMNLFFYNDDVKNRDSDFRGLTTIKRLLNNKEALKLVKFFK